MDMRQIKLQCPPTECVPVRLPISQGNYKVFISRGLKYIDTIVFRCDGVKYWELTIDEIRYFNESKGRPWKRDTLELPIVFHKAGAEYQVEIWPDDSKEQPIHTLMML